MMQSQPKQNRSRQKHRHDDQKPAAAFQARRAKLAAGRATLGLLLAWLALQDLLAGWTGQTCELWPAGRRQCATRGELNGRHWSLLALAADSSGPHNGRHAQPSRRQVSAAANSSADGHPSGDNELGEELEQDEQQQQQQQQQLDEEGERQQSLCNQYINIKNSIPSVLIRLLFFSLYGSILAIGLLGNTLTLYAMRRKREKSSIIDIFIANLALSDIMLCIFAVPITPIYMLYHGHWVFGAGLCKAFAFAQGASVYISTFTMISIAHLRYQLIVHPLNEQMSKLAALLLNLCTWIIGFLVTLPYLMHVGLLPENCAIKFCDEYWEQELDRFWFSVITLILQFFLPFIAVSFFYGSIFWKLRQQRLRRQRKLDSVLQRALSQQHQHQHHFYQHLYRHHHHHSPHSHHSHRPHLAHHHLHLEHHSEQQQQQQQLGLTDHQWPRPAATGEQARPLELAGAGEPAQMLLVRLQPPEEPAAGPREARPLRSFALSSAGIMASITLPRVPPGPPAEPEAARRRMTMSEAERAAAAPSPDQPASAGALKRTLSQRARPAEQQQQQQQLELQLASRRPPANNPATAAEEPSAGADILALKEQRLRDKDKRLSQTNRKLLFMVLLFVFSWLPLNMFNLVQDYSETISESPYIKHVFLIVHLVACSSVCYNPILYAWMSDNYRQELRDILPSRLAKRCCCLLAAEPPAPQATT